MSEAECCSPQQNESTGSSNSPKELMDDLNKHYIERIRTIEKAGHTELLVTNLKKWIEALIDNDISLVTTIDSLEREVLEKSDQMALICNERFEMEQICEKYKTEMCEKTKLLNELNCKLKEQTETMNQKECIIKRLTHELDRLKFEMNKLKNEGDDDCKESKSRLSEMKCQLDSLKEDVQKKDCFIKKLEEDLCLCKKQIEEFNDAKEQTAADGKSESQQVKDLLNQLTSLKARISKSDENFEEQLKKIQLLQDEIEEKNQELAVLKLNSIPYIEEEEKQQRYMKEKQIDVKLEESCSEIERLNKILITMQSSGESQQLEILRKDLDNMKRENRDMKEALTAEVCEKHDMITSLRRDTAQLEEKARQADMQAIFKDDIIKELRKEVKIARAKESFVEMLGLNEGSRVQMKSKIDSLMAELEEKQSEIISLEDKLEEMNRHALEGKLGEMSLQLMDRERDMIILCNKVDYIKRYLDKLHEDEDISIKCGLKALLLELNEETEWRRKARRSVTSLGDQPESVIIINRSNSLPAEASEHVRYNGRVNELEIKLERAREEICCLRKKLDAKEAEIISLKENSNRSENLCKTDKAVLPDSLLPLKLEQFQKFSDESGKKLQETLNNVKQHTGNLLLKEEMADLNCFLTAEQETFVKANRQLHVLLCNMKNSNQSFTTPANYKLQCLENKLKNALDELESEKRQTKCPPTSEVTNDKLCDKLMAKVVESLRIIGDLKQDAPQIADSNEPVSSASSTKLIQEVQEMIKIIQNQSKIQQSRLFASLDNQKEEMSSLCKKFSEVDFLVKSHCKEINCIKDELKISLCNINQKAEKVKKQIEHITQFECSVKDISNWINQNLKNNADIKNKVCNLQKNLEQILCMKNIIDDSRKEARSNRMLSVKQSSCQKQTQSTPELCQTSSDLVGPDLSDFDDKCIIAQELCDEVRKEMDKAACRINEREQKITQLSKDISSFEETICCVQDEIVKAAHLLSGECDSNSELNSSEDIICHIQDFNNRLIQILHNVKHKIINHLREADSYDIKGIESRKIISAKLCELEDALGDIAEVLGEMKESDYRQSMRAFEEDSEMIRPEAIIEEMKNEIYHLNDTIIELNKQIKCQQGTIESLKCHLAKSEDEADRSMQLMDNDEITKLLCERNKLNQEMTELKRTLDCKSEKILMMKKEYCWLTQEINKLTKIVQEEKISSSARECDLKNKNADLMKELCLMKKKHHATCRSLASKQAVNDHSRTVSRDKDIELYQKKLSCVQENYNKLLCQYQELCRNHESLNKTLQQKVSGCMQSNQTCERSQEMSQGDKSVSSEEYQRALKEINHLRHELDQVNCDYERIKNENVKIIRELEDVNRQYDLSMSEQQKVCNERDNACADIENYLTELKCNQDEITQLKNEHAKLCKKYELQMIEAEDLKAELGCSVEKVRQLEMKLKSCNEKIDLLRCENNKIHIENITLQKEISELCEKNKILRDEECREHMILKKKYDDVKVQLQCAESKIEELDTEIQKVEKRSLESAILEADTQLLITKTDQEWNEMYVKKCTEVMELTEENECLRKELIDVNSRSMVKNEECNENKRIVAMLKHTLQDYKSQIACLKGKYDKSICWNRDLKRQLEVQDKSNRSMKQLICFLNKEKKELLEKLSSIQSDGSMTYEDSVC